MEQLQIALVVNCTEQVYELNNKSIEVVRHNVRKNCALSLKEYYEGINETIDGYVRSGRNVLIHCYYGSTRSSTCAIAYFMWKRRWTYDQAYALVSERRKECDIPYDMEMMLREYENQLVHGVQNRTVDADYYNSVITVTVKEGTNEEAVVAEMMKYTNCNHSVRIGRYERSTGCYGSTAIAFEAFIDEAVDEEVLEEEIYSCMASFDVLSVQVRVLDE